MSLRRICSASVLKVYRQSSSRIQQSLSYNSNTSNHKKQTNHLVICSLLYTRLETKEDLKDKKRERVERKDERMKMP